MKRAILGLLLLSIHQPFFSLGAITFDEQVILAIDSQDLTTLMSLGPEIAQLSLSSYIKYAEHQAKSASFGAIDAEDNVVGLFKMLVGAGLLGGIVTYTAFKYYLLANGDSEQHGLSNFLRVFERADDESWMEYTRDQLARCIDFAVPMIIGFSLIAKGKKLHSKPSNKVVMKRLAIVIYLKSLQSAQLN